MQHGRIAALNMAGIRTPYELVPFFWTRQHGKGFTVAGHPQGWDDIAIDGNIEDGEFLAYFLRDGKIIAAGGSGKSREMCAIEELMRIHQLPNAEAVKNQEETDWIALAM